MEHTNTAIDNLISISEITNKRIDVLNERIKILEKTIKVLTNNAEETGEHINFILDCMMKMVDEK